MGDFNEIIQQHEKHGGASKFYAQTGSFRQVMNES